MRKEWYERTAKHIAKREWEIVRDIWVEVTATLDSLAATEDDVSSLPTLIAELNVAALKSPPTIRNSSVPGLRASILSEGVAFLHKAAHITAASQHLVDGKHLTWSIPNYYQASTMARDAVLRLLGVCFVDVQQKLVLVDCFSSEKKASKKERPEHLIEHVVSSKPPLAHRPSWHFFTRVLRVARVPENVWPRELVSALERRSVSDFAHARNQLLYRPHSWRFEDLHSLDCTKDVDEFSAVDDLVEAIDDPDSDQFGSAVAFSILFLALQLLVDLSSRSPTALDEASKLDIWSGDARTERYRRGFEDWVTSSTATS